MLAEYQNPFDRNYTPATWDLIEDCRLWAERREGDKFRESYWQPFLSIRGELPKLLTKSIWIGHLLDDSGQLRLTDRSGRGSTRSKLFLDLKNPEKNLPNLGILWG